MYVCVCVCVCVYTLHICDIQITSSLFFMILIFMILTKKQFIFTIQNSATIFVYIFDFSIILSYCVKRFKYFIYPLNTLANIFLNGFTNILNPQSWNIGWKIPFGLFFFLWTCYTVGFVLFCLGTSYHFFSCNLFYF